MLKLLNFSSASLRSIVPGCVAVTPGSAQPGTATNSTRYRGVVALKIFLFIIIYVRLFRYSVIIFPTHQPAGQRCLCASEGARTPPPLFFFRMRRSFSRIRAGRSSSPALTLVARPEDN